MALTNKRIIDLPERATLNSDDYTVVDGSNGGTGKYKLSKIQDNIDDVAQDITDLKEDLSDLLSDGVVPTSRQLLSDKYAVDQTPYKYRASYSGDRMDDEIVGGSVVWNQAFIPTYASTGPITSDGVTITNNNDGSYTLNGTSTATGKFSMMSSPQGFIVQNHIYFFGGCPSGGGATRFAFGIAGLMLDTGDGGLYKHIYDWTVSAFRLDFKTGITFSSAKFIPQVFDLTAMFGTAVADYIYGLEQSSAGAGVALFRKMFPEEYYEHSDKTLQHVEGLSAHVMRDADNNIIANYPLDSALTLRGAPKVGSNGMYFDGDRYLADGTVKRRYGIVDLGTLSWTYMTDYNRFQAMLTGIVTNKAVRTVNMVCSKLVAITDGRAITAVVDKCIYGAGDNSYIYVHDSAYTDAAAFKTAMSGVMLVYELATPTAETAQPYTALQTVDASGTEEYVSTSIVPVGHYTKYYDDLRKKLDDLPWNLGDMIAPTETGTTASQAYAVGKYFILDNQLCKAKTAIASGATFTLNTNYEVTTVADELYTALHS